MGRKGDGKGKRERRRIGGWEGKGSRTKGVREGEEGVEMVRTRRWKGKKSKKERRRKK